MAEFNIDSGGKRYTVEAGSESAARAAVAQDQSTNAGLGMFAIILIGGALLTIVIGFVLAFNLTVYIFKTFPLFILSVAAALAALIVVRKLIPIRFLRMLLALVAAGAVGYGGITASLAYYKNSDFVHPSRFGVDYIQALPGGGAPEFHSKRFKKGDALGPLAVGQKVSIVGITLDEAEYRITTAGGQTGWVEVDALPEEDKDTLGSVLEVTGVRALSGQHDRDVDNMKARYNANGPEDSYRLKESALAGARPIGITTPMLTLDEASYIEGESLAPTRIGTTITLASAAYHDDCTILMFTVTDADSDSRPHELYNARNAAGWNDSLVVTDLDTGEKYPVLPRGYETNAIFWRQAWSGADHNAWWSYGTQGKDALLHQIVFFPPFKSRHFSLTHDVEPLPEKPGKVSSFLKGFTTTSALYIDWNFPEVRVR